MREEIVRVRERVRARRRNVETAREARMVRKETFDECDRIACVIPQRHGGIGRKPHAANGRPAVVGIEIPRVSGRLVTVHQETRLLAHLSVERLHRDARLTAREERREFILRRDEVRVRRNFRLEAEARDRFRQSIVQAEFRLAHHAKARRRVRRDVVGERRFVALFRGTIVDRPPRRAQVVREAAHCREDEHELSLVVRDLSRARERFDEQYDGAARVESDERRIPGHALVARHPHRRRPFRHFSKRHGMTVPSREARA